MPQKYFGLDRDKRGYQWPSSPVGSDAWLGEEGRVLPEHQGMSREQILAQREQDKLDEEEYRKLDYQRWGEEQKRLEEAGPVIMETSLAEQVSPYYRHVPGGFGQAVKDALAAQEDRGDRFREGAEPPPLTKEDIYQKFPIRRQLSPNPGYLLDKDVKYLRDREAPSVGGYATREYPPRRPHWNQRGEKESLLELAFRTLVGPAPNYIIDKATPDRDINQRIFVGLPHEMNESEYRRYRTSPESSPWSTMPLYDGPSNRPHAWNPTGKFYPPPSYKTDPQITLEHELTHAATLRGASLEDRLGPWGDPVAVKRKDFPDPEHWAYWSTPVEQDPRLAEVKRAYSSATGRPVKTMEDAEDAWNWWGTEYIPHGGRGRRSNVGSGWTVDRWEELEHNPEEKARALQRMRELIQYQPGSLSQALIG